MKDPKDYLNISSWNGELVFNKLDEIIVAINQAQKDAYNEALEDVNKIIEDSIYDLEYFSESEELKSDILKLKKD